MYRSRLRRRCALLPLAAAATAAVLAFTGLPHAAAAPNPAPAGPAAGRAAAERKGSFDARSIAPGQRLGTLRAVRPDAEQVEQGLRQRLGSQAVVDLDPVTGTPAMIGRLDGFLTAPSTAPAQAVVQRYLTRNLAMLGLSEADLKTFRLRRDYVDVAGIRHLSWTQSARGIQVFGNGLKANVTKRGQLISLQGSPVAGLGRKADAADVTADLSPTAARQAAAAEVGVATSAARPVFRGRTATWVNHDQASLVWFVPPDGVRLAWST